MEARDIMTAKELQKRNGKSENLRVLQAEDGGYYVESSEGKILYNININDEGISCTCGDWARNSKKDSSFRCKHILSVMNCIPNGQVESAHFMDRKKPNPSTKTKTPNLRTQRETGSQAIIGKPSFFSCLWPFLSN